MHPRHLHSQWVSAPPIRLHHVTFAQRSLALLTPLISPVVGPISLTRGNITRRLSTMNTGSVSPSSNVRGQTPFLTPRQPSSWTSTSDGHVPTDHMTSDRQSTWYSVSTIIPNTPGLPDVKGCSLNECYLATCWDTIITCMNKMSTNYMLTYINDDGILLLTHTRHGHGSQVQRLLKSLPDLWSTNSCCIGTP